jgi:uncharacterized cupredoxin-like copper-binding protein
MLHANFRVAFAASLATILSIAASPFPLAAHDGHAHGDAAHGATSTDGAPGRPADVKRTIRIEATDNAFNVGTIQVHEGETIRFLVTNAGYNAHEFAIASPEENAEHRAMMRQMPHMKHADPNMVTIEPGETKELIWRFGKDRNVEFSCNIPRHAEEGMHGIFQVMR